MTLTTKIKAVNTMLRGAGYRQTATLTGSLPREVDMALQTLDEIDIEVQTEGWKFNKQTEVAYTPDPVDSTIVVGTDILNIDGSPNRSENSGLDLIHLGQNLMDAATNNLTFTKTVYCDQTVRRDWDQIPEPFRRYITIRATRRFSDDMNADHGTHIYKEKDEMKARRTAKKLDDQQRDTVMKNLPAVDNRTSVLGRGRIRH